MPAAVCPPPISDLIDRLHDHAALDRLPLAWHRYPPQLAADVMEAICDALDTEASWAPTLADDLPGTGVLPDTAPRLIIVSGKPRAGKDVVAQIIYSEHANVGRVMTSDAIRDEVNIYLAAYGHRIAETNKSEPQYRRLLQAWGMSRQEENPDYWPARALDAVRNLWRDGARLVVLTGLRWPHDAQRFRDAGGELWRVVRPGNPYVAEHYAEAGLDAVPDSFFDRIVRNDIEGDLARVAEQVRGGLRRNG